MTKLLFYIPGTIIGGAETQLLTLVRHLPHHKYDIKIVTNERNHSHPFWADIGRAAPLHVCAGVDDITAFVKNWGPDLIQHFHNPWMGAALERCDYKGAVVEVVHGRVHFPNDITTTTKARTTHVVAVSADAESFFLGALPEWRGRTTVISNGVDTNRFKPRAALLPPEPVRILHVGRLCEGDKQYAKIIRACTALPQLPWELWLVGNGADFQAIHDDAAYTAPGRVKFFGFCDRPEDIYRNADIYVSRSPTEGFGLSIAEAAASGLPVTMWDCGGVSPYFTNEENALITTDERQFARNLTRLVQNTELRKRLGRGARAVAETSFGATAMAAAYGRLYDKLLSATSAVAAPTRKRIIIGISNPNFTGVTNATRCWVGAENWVAAPPGAGVVDEIVRRKPEILVLGGDSGYMPLVRQLRQKMQELKIVMTWHSTLSFNSFCNDGVLLAQWICALKSGVIDRLGFVKPGMHAAINHPGAVWFPNRVPKVKHGTPVTLPQGFHIGIFGSGFPWKNMEALIVGASLVPNAVVHVNHLEYSAVIEELGIQFVNHGPMERGKFHALLAAMDVNVQAGFTESFGLTFCESYLLDVPCVTSAGVQPLPGSQMPWQIEDVDDPQAVARAITAIHAVPQLQRVQKMLREYDEVAEAQIDKVLEEL